MLVERLTSDKLNYASTFPDGGQPKVDEFETIETLVRRGNEGSHLTNRQTCCLCGKVYSSRSKLRRHILTVHRLNCASNFSHSGLSKADEKEILALIRNGNKGLSFLEPHTCCFCKKVVSNRGTLKRHMLTIHCGSTKVFCDLCPKFYFSKSDLLVHMKNVHSGKRYSCNVCDYKTATRGHIIKHKMIHADKVQCPICKKQVTALKFHMKLHKPREKCQICQKMFTKHSLKKHMATHTRNAPKCKSCEETFADKAALRMQVVIFVIFQYLMIF